MNNKKTFVCMKWGTRYPADFANRLYSMIKRNMKSSFRLVCYTDDTNGLLKDIEAYPLPPIDLPSPHEFTPWRKLSLWSSKLPELYGDVLFLDLDLVITGSMDEFFEYKPEASFCIIENWTQLGSGIGNTSVYRFRVGEHAYIFDDFERDPVSITNRYSNEQKYISDVITSKEFWPADWCVSFKHTLLPSWPLNFFKVPALPPKTKIVAFTGKPDPDDALEGRWPSPWYKKTYKYLKPAPWIGEHWR